MRFFRMFFGFLLGSLAGFLIFEGIGMTNIVLPPFAQLMILSICGSLGGTIFASWEKTTRESVHGKPIRVVFLVVLMAILLIIGLVIAATQLK